MIRERRYPCHDFPAQRLKAKTLELMTGKKGIPAGIDPETLLFLDTETTGLGGGAGTVETKMPLT